MADANGSSMGTIPGTGRPNILIIMTDQHRSDLMSCAGRQDVPTPNIDRIAARGVRFENAYCPYPVCLASRSSFLTGLYAHNTGAINNTDKLDWRYRTIAHHFSENGYITGLVGKMHFNDVNNHGFEYYMKINDWLMYLGPKVGIYANEIANHPLWTHFYNTVIDDGAGFPDVSDLWEGQSPWVGNVKQFDYEHMKTMASELEAQDHLDAFTAREAVKFIRRYKSQPFFLVASFMKPHSPFFPPREYAELYPIDDMRIPPPGELGQYPCNVRDQARHFRSMGLKRQQAHRAGYYGNLAFVDHCIGSLYDELEKLDITDKTILVYTSDHGDMDGDHGLFQKFCLFEPSVKVPLIISYPGHLPENVVTSALTEYIGVYPTLADLTGTVINSNAFRHDTGTAPKAIDAQSFADILLDPGKERKGAVFCENNLKSGNDQYMIRTKRYKFNYTRGSTNELYDLDVDPGENVNLINHPGMKKVIEELKERLFAWYDPENNRFY